MAVEDTGAAGRTALVTGGGTGIGRATALALSGAGARVALVGRRPEPLSRVAAEIAAADGEAFPVPCDVTGDEQLARGLDAAQAALGPVEILVHSAGVAPSAPLARITDEGLDQVFAVNLRAAFVLARLVAPAMKAAGYGRIVYVASTAALRGYRYTAAYTASKHALAGLTRSLSAELLPHGITVNAVCPGFTDTAVVREAAGLIADRTGRSAEEALGELAAANPLGRLVQPEEVARAVLYVVGPGSGAVSGHALVLDGGTQPM